MFFKSKKQVHCALTPMTLDSWHQNVTGVGHFSADLKNKSKFKSILKLNEMVSYSVCNFYYSGSKMLHTKTRKIVKELLRVPYGIFSTKV